VAAIAGGAAVVVPLLYWLHARLSPALRMRLVRMRDAHKLPNKIKILVGFYMIATQLGRVYEVTLPTDVRAIYQSIEVLLTLGIDLEFTPLECLGLHGYMWQLVFWTLLPIALGVCAFVCAAVWLAVRPADSLTAARLLEVCAPLSLRLLFLVYPVVTRNAFQAFSWHEFNDGAWLRADVSIRRGSIQDDNARAVAIVAILLYPVGMWLFFGALLLKAGTAILRKQPTPLSKAIAFLHREYEESFYWWELVEMLRRFVLVGVFVVEPGQGRVEQLAYAMIVSICFLALQLNAAPYHEPTDDFLAGGCSLLLAVLFVCSIFFKYAELTDSSAVQVIMNREQKDTYKPSFVAISAVVAGTSVGAFIVLALIVGLQAAKEARWVREARREAKARRLRYKDNEQEVIVPDIQFGHIDAKCYHLFLSHVWGTGQDQMRIIKQRLVDMMPDVVVFLDVDDLEEIGDLEGYIEHSSTILVYCSRGYMQSKNCMRELVSSTTKQKPIIALTDSEVSRGGLSLHEVRSQLDDAEDSYEKWSFELGTTPNASALYDHLCAYDPIEWNRIGHFQQVTMRLIAERLLPAAAGKTYLSCEIIHQKRTPLALPKGHNAYHVYISDLNPGADELIEEVAKQSGFTLELSEPARSHSPTRGERAARAVAKLTAEARRARRSARGHPTSGTAQASNYGVLHATTSHDDVAKCSHMLLYLTSQTWTREASGALAAELMTAMDIGVHILLAHEMPGAGQEARHGCEFGDFFACADGNTPEDLLKRGIYSEIAVPLKGGAWREVSMALMAKSLDLTKAEAQAVAGGDDVLGLDVEVLTYSSALLSAGKAQMQTAAAHVISTADYMATRRAQVAPAPAALTSIITRATKAVCGSFSRANTTKNCSSVCCGSTASTRTSGVAPTPVDGGGDCELGGVRQRVDPPPPVDASTVAAAPATSSSTDASTAASSRRRIRSVFTWVTSTRMLAAHASTPGVADGLATSGGDASQLADQTPPPPSMPSPEDPAPGPAPAPLPLLDLTYKRPALVLDVTCKRDARTTPLWR